MIDRICAYLLCLTIALQGALVAFAQQQNLSALQTSLPFDTELICTGAEMKWISVSQTQQSGHFVYVEPPTDIDNTLVNNACPAGLLADVQPATALVSGSLHSQFVAYQVLVQSLQQHCYTSFAYNTALSRAPPLV